ncbi:MAG: hypothetical protein CMM42_18175 [Rhodospirillaceae bacterium]|nr:hypothetical protein [Rhodospirillaceae bacterium]
MIMADIPFEATPNPSAYMVVSNDGHFTNLSAHLINTATHILADTSSLDSLGQLALPVGQQAIKALLLNGSDLIIIQQDGSLLIIDDFLGALEAGVLTGLRLSDGTSMDAIDFLDTFGDGDALNDIMYSLEAASIEEGVIDDARAIGQDGPSDVLDETLDFTRFGAQDTGNVDFGSSLYKADATDPLLAAGEPAPLVDTFTPESLDANTLGVSALLGQDMDPVLEKYLPNHHEVAGQQTAPLFGQDVIQTLDTDHALSFRPVDPIGFSDPTTDDVAVL